MTAFHSTAPTALGLLQSLSAALPSQDCPLARRARRLARQLAVRPSRALSDRAADLLTELLEATDVAEMAGYSDDGMLDSEWDA